MLIDLLRRLIVSRKLANMTIREAEHYLHAHGYSRSGAKRFLALHKAKLRLREPPGA